MEYLFNLDLLYTPLLILVSMWIIVVSPGRINALYHKVNIIKKTHIEVLGELIWISLNMAFLLYFTVTYTFTNILSYVWFTLMVLALAFFILIIVVDKINRYKNFDLYNKNLHSIRKIYYGKEDVAVEMKEISDKYNGVTFKASVSNTPLQIHIKIQEDSNIEELLDTIRNEKSLFLDLKEQKYRYKLYAYIVIVSFAIAYLSILAIYNIF